MKLELIFLIISFFFQIPSQQINTLISVIDIEAFEKQLKDEKVSYYIKYTQRKRKGKKSKIDFISFIIARNGIVEVQKYKKTLNQEFILVESNRISSTNSITEIHNFVKDFKLIEKGSCYHYFALDLLNPPVGTIDFNIDYSKNEWMLTLVKEESGDYAHYFAFKHKKKNKCISIKENIKMRKRFKKFKKLISD